MMSGTADHANLISLIGGHKVNVLLTSNIYSFKLGMSNRTRYAETVQ